MAMRKSRVRPRVVHGGPPAPLLSVHAHCVAQWFGRASVRTTHSILRGSLLPRSVKPPARVLACARSATHMVRPLVTLKILYPAADLNERLLRDCEHHCFVFKRVYECLAVRARMADAMETCFAVCT